MLMNMFMTERMTGQLLSGSVTILFPTPIKKYSARWLLPIYNSALFSLGSLLLACLYLFLIALSYKILKRATLGGPSNTHIP